MYAEFIVRFQERKTFIAARIPAPKNLPEPIAVSEKALDAEQKTETRGQGPRISVYERMGQIQQQLQDPTFAKAHQRYVWQDTAYPAGQLMFAALDLPWAEYARQADTLLARFAEQKVEIDSDFLNKMDWTEQGEAAPTQEASTAPSGFVQKLFDKLKPTVPARTEAPQEPVEEHPTVASRTVAQGLADAENAVYCLAAKLYNEILDGLADYPAMRQLLKQAFAIADSGYYAAALNKLSPARLTPEQQELWATTWRGTALRDEVNKVSALESAAHTLEMMLSGCQLPGDGAAADADDRALCGAALTFLRLLVAQLHPLAEFQPHLSQLVEYTLAAADRDSTRRADQRYLDAQYISLPGLLAGERLSAQLGMKLLSSLSFPEVDEKARKMPKLSGQMYFCAETLAALAMAELTQLCYQRQTVRTCGYCGKLFIPFSTKAKYCDRRVPGHGEHICKEVAAAEQTQEKLSGDRIKAVYNAVANRVNARMSRGGYAAADRKYHMDLWHAKAKAAAKEIRDGQIEFDEKAFDARLEEIYAVVLSQVRAEKAATQKAREREKKRLPNGRMPVVSWVDTKKK